MRDPGQLQGFTERHPAKKSFVTHIADQLCTVASHKIGGPRNQPVRGTRLQKGGTQFCKDRAHPFQMMDGASHPRGTGGLLPPQALSKAKRERETDREKTRTAERDGEREMHLSLVLCANSCSLLQIVALSRRECCRVMPCLCSSLHSKTRRVFSQEGESPCSLAEKETEKQASKNESKKEVAFIKSPGKGKDERTWSLVFACCLRSTCLRSREVKIVPRRPS